MEGLPNIVHLTHQLPETHLLTGDPFLEYYTLPISDINPSLLPSLPPLPQHQTLLQPGEGFEVPDYLESPALPSVINPYEYPSHRWTEVVDDDVLHQRNPQEGDNFATDGQDYQDDQDEYDTFPFGSRSQFSLQPFYSQFLDFSASRLPAVILNEVVDEVVNEVVNEVGEAGDDVSDQQPSVEGGWKEVVSSQFPLQTLLILLHFSYSIHFIHPLSSCTDPSCYLRWRCQQASLGM